MTQDKYLVGGKLITYSQMVDTVVKPGEAIIAELTPATADLLHMAAGVAGEAGELLDAIKKNAIYGKPLDHDNVIEELGDLEFYMERIRQRCGIRREDTLKHNVFKLAKRYENLVYSNQAAQDRADKTGETV